MSQIQPNNQIQTYPTGTPLYTCANAAMLQPQYVSVAPSQNITAPYYQYPQTSVYNDPSKQPASGVNIYIYNPSAISGQTSNCMTPAQQPPQIINTVCTPGGEQVTPQPQISSTPIANTPIKEEPEVNSEQKTKRVVELTDDYIKSLESYLHSPDETIRKMAVQEIVQRYEEDNTRFDDPALTALLNIALQDPSPHNRLLAMCAVSGGSAHGDNNTIKILNELTKSDKLYGQEAKMASSALIKAARETKLVPDYSDDKKSEKK